MISGRMQAFIEICCSPTSGGIMVASLMTCEESLEKPREAASRPYERAAEA